MYRLRFLRFYLPVGAIKEADGKYEIGDECVECGACAGVCPVGAIKQP